MTWSTVQIGAVVLLIGLVVLGVARFEMYCLTDLAETPDYQLSVLNRQGWIVLILVFIPVGGVFYLLYGRPR